MTRRGRGAGSHAERGVDVVYEERGEVSSMARTTSAGSTSGSATAFRRSRRVAGFPGSAALPAAVGYIDPEDARALDFAKPGQPLVWPGQFLFGYPSQRDAEPASEPGPEADGGYPWMADGSFLVFRRPPAGRRRIPGVPRRGVGAYRRGRPRPVGRHARRTVAERNLGAAVTPTNPRRRRWRTASV